MSDVKGSTSDEAPGPEPGPPAGGAPSLLEFPVDFPIKVMGRSSDGFIDAIVAIVVEHAPDFDPSTVETRPSTQGNYVGVTATIRATSREQLDALYHALTAHPMVKVVL